MTHYRASSLIDYLDACYPEKKEEHVRFRNTAPESNAWAYVRNYGHFYNLTRQKEDNESHQPVPVYDKRFKDLFFPAAPVSKQTSTSYQSASLPIDSKTAFSIIREALNSPDPLVQQAALYAFRWFSKGRPAELTEKVRGFASSDRFPHYLYAAASLAVVEYNSPVVRSAADRAFGFLDPVIRKRSRAEDTGATAFNALLLMDLCRMSGKIKEYEQLLDFVLQPDTAGRYGYEGFQADLEKSIATSSVGSGTLNRLLDSSRPLDTIVGIRLAALKNYPLATDRLTRYLRHDDSYVRRAAASYVIAHKAQFPDLFSALSNNTNRVVRAMLSNASAP